MWWKKMQAQCEQIWDRIVSVSAGNSEDVRLGRLFNTLMMISTIIVIALTISLLSMKPMGYIQTDVNLIAAVFPIVFTPFSLFCLFLAKRGHLHGAIRLYSWMNFIMISMAVWIFDGVHSPAWQLYMWTITVAGILLTPAYALWMTGGIVMYFFLIVGLSSAGLYTPVLTLTAVGDEYLNIVFRLIMFISTVGFLTYLNMRSLRDALQRLHGAMTELKNVNVELHIENKERRQVEIENQTLIKELQESLSSIKTLSGLLPICASCKKIRDDKGYWNQVEKYIGEHTAVQFSHGICPDCLKKIYPDYQKKKKDE